MGNRDRRKAKQKQQSNLNHPVCCYQMLTKAKKQNKLACFTILDMLKPNTCNCHTLIANKSKETRVSMFYH